MFKSSFFICSFNLLALWITAAFCYPDDDKERVLQPILNNNNEYMLEINSEIMNILSCGHSITYTLYGNNEYNIKLKSTQGSTVPMITSNAPKNCIQINYFLHTTNKNYVCCSDDLCAFYRRHHYHLSAASTWHDVAYITIFIWQA